MQLDSMAGHLIRRLHQKSTRIFSDHMQAAGCELTSVQFAAMSAISAEPGLDQAGIAEAIAYDRATIGGVIDRLEQKGLVERNVSSRDRRAREVRLSEAGAQLLAGITPIVDRLQEAILKGLTKEEKETFLRMARTIVRK